MHYHIFSGIWWQHMLMCVQACCEKTCFQVCCDKTWIDVFSGIWLQHLFMISGLWWQRTCSHVLQQDAFSHVFRCLEKTRQAWTPLNTCVVTIHNCTCFQGVGNNTHAHSCSHVQPMEATHGHAYGGVWLQHACSLLKWQHMLTHVQARGGNTCSHMWNHSVARHVYMCWGVYWEH